jgi:raffinose/stachyose/melibiose transport system substrate-binding protein
LITFRHITLAAILGLSAWALWPPAKDQSVEAKAAEASNVAAKYHIRMAPGVYMPGTRPQDVGGKLKGLREVAAAFHKLHPDTVIDFVDVPQTREYLVTQLMGEQAPDIININVEDVWQDVQKGWYVPLDPYLEAPNPYSKTGQPGSKQWWDLFKYQAISRGKAAPDGKMYCITLDMIETGIFYNKDIFKKVGVEPPRDWPHFLQIQEKLQKAGYIPMLVDQGALADWGVDLMFDQFYRDIRPAIDVKKDPKRDAYMKGYLDWDEIAFLYKKGFFRKDDPRWRVVFRQLKDWRRYFVKDFGSVSTERSFISQKGAMYWSSSFTVNKLSRDPNLGFEWDVFYLPPIPKSYRKYANSYPMCVIGEAATQYSVTNSAINDTGDAKTSEKLKRVVAFLQFMCMPENTDKVVNEIVALMPNIVGVRTHKELARFQEILERDYAMSKWMFTFDLRFNEIWSRMLFLYLQDGISEDEFIEWIDKNVGLATDTVVRRKKLDLTQFESAWQQSAGARRSMEDLPLAARP